MDAGSSQRCNLITSESNAYRLFRHFVPRLLLLRQLRRLLMVPCLLMAQPASRPFPGLTFSLQSSQ